MTFDEVLEQVRALLQSKGRVAYRALKRRFDLEDEYLEDLKAELIDAEQVARDEEGLSVLAEALETVDKTGMRYNEAELYRLKGQLLLNAERGMMNAKHLPFIVQHSEFIVLPKPKRVSTRLSSLPACSRRSLGNYGQY
jgi:hypothetical protein